MGKCVFCRLAHANTIVCTSLAPSYHSHTVLFSSAQLCSALLSSPLLSSALLCSALSLPLLSVSICISISLSPCFSPSPFFFSLSFSLTITHHQLDRHRLTGEDLCVSKPISTVETEERLTEGGSRFNHRAASTPPHRVTPGRMPPPRAKA